MSYLYLQQYAGVRASCSGFDTSAQTKFERHCHSNYELIYILQGEGNYIVEGVDYPLHPHALLLMRPYEYHYVCPRENQFYERVVINFEAEILPECLRTHPMLAGHHGNYFSLKSINNPIRGAYDLLTQLVPLSADGMQSTPEAEALLRATVTQILLLLTLETPEKTISPESDTVLRIIEYLNRHLCEEISLDAIAHEFFISKYHLCRMFRQQTGASIFTYFNTKRMALAQQMLNAGENATTVALRLGFRDYSTFYRAYRKQTGESPVRKIQ
ncbi:MAG: helix-turn-helix transcriptional regulator [Clostridia bacterium]|nr:helix-turn-helix transcriptional regulator [Clostridia bacterium]